jgi:hypothetical protein
MLLTLLSLLSLTFFISRLTIGVDAWDSSDVAQFFKSHCPQVSFPRESIEKMYFTVDRLFEENLHGTEKSVKKMYEQVGAYTGKA